MFLLLPLIYIIYETIRRVCVSVQLVLVETLKTSSNYYYDFPARREEICVVRRTTMDEKVSPMRRVVCVCVLQLELAVSNCVTGSGMREIRGEVDG